MKRYDLDKNVAKHLVKTYGIRAEAIAHIAHTHPPLKHSLYPGYPFIEAEIGKRFISVLDKRRACGAGAGYLAPAHPAGLHELRSDISLFAQNCVVNGLRTGLVTRNNGAEARL